MRLSAKRGWDAITDACVAAVAARDEPSVFILWGSHAQAKATAMSMTDLITTRLGLHIAGQPSIAYIPFALICGFVTGVVLGSLLASRWPDWRKRAR